MRWLVLLVCACSGSNPKPPGPTTTPTPVPIDAPVAKELPPPEHCPSLSYNNVGFWRSEIFPACPDEPLLSFSCNGGGCEYPCKETTTINGKSTVRTDVYENGHFISRGYQTPPEILCRYEANVRTECDLYSAPWVAHRDAEGRVVEITSQHHRSIIRYNPRGRPISVDGLEVLYDAEGRMVKLGESTFEWEGRRVVRDRTPARTATYEYDSQGRTVRVAFDEVGKNREIVIRYDGSRVAGWHSETVDVKYDYTCP